MADETKTVVTERAEMTTDKELNSVTVVSMPPWKIALVRCCRVYLQSLVGFLLATGTGATAAAGLTMPVTDFYHILVVSASMAVAPATISLIQNIIELLAKLDATNPTLRA
jgi:hypothetical protein